MIIGIDQSKRSTAVVAIDLKGNLLAFEVVSPAASLDGVDLLLYQWRMVSNFMENLKSNYKITAIAMEGLSFNSVGAGKDMLAGLYWYLKTNMSRDYGFVGSIPVLAWRAKVLDKDERKSIAAVKAKDGIKKATVSKLPFLVKARFEKYILDNGLKKESIYDLADAWWIAKYRLSLED